MAIVNKPNRPTVPRPNRPSVPSKHPTSPTPNRPTVTPPSQRDPYTYGDYRGQNPNYKPIDNSGTDYASGMSKGDYDALSKAWADWNAASQAGDRAGMDAAHAAAEAIRGQYGYSGGVDGSQYLPTQSGPQAPSYTGKYQDQIDSLLGELLNREDFKYNYLEDPLFQQYRDMYTREGNRAMLDTLGQAAARTGGYLSTAGQTAAQQANNYYMSQLGDKIPELQQLAYSMYMDGIDGKRTDLGILQGLEEFNYGKYQDQLGQFNTDRDFAFDANRYENETAYDRALQRAKMLAQVGDYSGYKALGYSDSDIARLEAAFQLSATKPSGGRGSGGNPTGSNADYEGLFAAAMESGHPQSFIANNYKKYGFSSQTGLWNEYQDWGVAQESMQSDGVKNYGPKYSDLYRDAYTMRQNGYTNQQILEHLDQFDDGITDAGIKSIIEQLKLA